MTTPAITSVLLIDALNRTLRNPSASQRWHALLELYSQETSDELKGKILATLAVGAPRQGIGGYLYLTFLFEISNDVAHLAEAAEQLLAIEPFDPDRLMAFAVYVWGVFISKGGDRARFVDVLRMLRIPELVGHVGGFVQERAAKTLPPRQVEAIRKVALVASYIGQDSHAPTPLALQHAKLLKDLGYDVTLFSPQELRIPDMGEYFGNSAHLTTFAPDYAKLRKNVPEGINVTLSDERFSLARRWDDLLISLARFDPDLVMFVGLNSPFLSGVYQARPVLGLCVHAVQPMAPCDVWLTADSAQAGKSGTMWAPSLPAALGHHHPFRVKLKPRGADLARAEFDLSESGVVLLSVGARLRLEIGGEWAARMVELLRRHPDVQWLLVGGVAARPAALLDLPDEQVLMLPYRDDIRSVMRTADIYLNPPRVGGGFSVAEAMAEGLAVLALQNSDGGDKIGAAASVDIDAYFAELELLIQDGKLRRERGEAMRTLFAQTLDLDNSADSLRTACELSVERYRERVK